MAGKFASSAFATGPQDDYRTVDVYKQDGKSLISSYTERRLNPEGTNSGVSGFFSSPLKTLGLSTAEAVRAGKTVYNFGDALGQAKGLQGTIDRVNAGIPGIASIIGKSSPGLQKTLMGEVNGINGQIGSVKGIFATVGNTIARVKSGNLPDLRGVTGLLNKVTGTNLFDISDKDSLLGMSAGLAQQAMRGGIPKSVGALAKNFLNEPDLLGKFIDKTLPTIMQTSDLGALKEIADIEPNMILLTNPTVLQDFSFNYTTPEGTKQEAKLELFSDMKETYSTIQRDWLSCTRTVTDAQGIPVPTESFDISRIANASGDFKDILKTGALVSDKLEDKLLLIETNPIAYLKEGAVKATEKIPDVREQLKKAFPQVAVTAQAPAQKKVVAPTAAKNGVIVEERLANYSAGGRTPTIVKTTWPDGHYVEVETLLDMFGNVSQRFTVTFDSKGNKIDSKKEDFRGRY